MAKKILAWINSDLDGVGCAVLLRSMFPQLEHMPVFFGDFETKYSEWSEVHLDDYDNVFIVGIPLDQKLINRLDDKKIIFVTNDYDTRLKSIDSSIISSDVSSNCKLLYQNFKHKIDYPVNIKKLIGYIDDYTSQTLRFEEGKYLNAIYRKSGSNKFNYFTNRFSDGFDGFTDNEVRLADIYFKGLEKATSELELFKGTYKGSNIIATFSEFSVNEISQEIFNGYDCDCVIVVNLSNKYVSFRKSKCSNTDIKFLAENLCGGGGTSIASAGKLTPKFLDFTSTLNPL